MTRPKSGRSVSRPRLTLLAGGDIEWQSAVVPPSILLDVRDSHDGGWLPVPLVDSARARALIRRDPRSRATFEHKHAASSVHHTLAFADDQAMTRYPFMDIANVLRSADLTFLNLEMPLSARAMKSGAFLGSPTFAEALRWAGVGVVSVANNHVLDAGEPGLRDTLSALGSAAIATVGAGSTLAVARRPFITTRNGISLGMLAYNQVMGAGGTAVFATKSRCGVAPLDPFIIDDDVRRLRRKVDVIVVSCHWGQENTFEVHPAARRFAHRILDAGADIVLGHHPHLPQGVEVRGGKAVIYSLGNFAFGHAHDYWDDNILARIELAAGRISAIEILPIAGRNGEVARPRILHGARARRVLELVRAHSRELDTDLSIDGAIGRIRLQ